MSDMTPAQFPPILERLATPVWIFSHDQGRVLWANPSALAFWKAESVSGLRRRNMTPVSPAIQRRFQHYMKLFQSGEDIWERWTFYPRDEPTTVFCRCSGIGWEGENAILFEAYPENVRDSEEGERHTRSLGMLQDMPVVCTLLLVDGTAVFQNMAADTTFGSLDEVPFFERFTERREIETLIDAAWSHGETAIRLLALNTIDDIAWYQIGALRTRDRSTGAPAVLVYGFDVTRQELEKDLTQCAEFAAL
ncbi:hypothetical protein IHV25_05575 [Phaeovibrio sulfidiphilus]|uniref:PAS domain-containing protein n=1 Tax=Phaeovibrio sulfidiphilus TaxID=1220600 RepID=A0A8J6YME7_9PROT|nr:hypothetical protein [Phaeovibrio sulfidiphilus]MBE1237115.1 hypothetical protein [Phaeovibrio sulfidiphilus]